MASRTEMICYLSRVPLPTATPSPDLTALRRVAAAIGRPSVDDAVVVETSSPRIAARLEIRYSDGSVGTLELRAGEWPRIDEKEVRIKTSSGWEMLDRAIFGETAAWIQKSGTGP